VNFNHRRRYQGRVPSLELLHRKFYTNSSKRDSSTANSRKEKIIIAIIVIDTKFSQGRVQLLEDVKKDLSRHFYSPKTIYALFQLPYPLTSDTTAAAKQKVSRLWRENRQRPEVTEFQKKSDNFEPVSVKDSPELSVLGQIWFEFCIAVPIRITSHQNTFSQQIPASPPERKVWIEINMPSSASKNAREDGRNYCTKCQSLIGTLNGLKAACSEEGYPYWSSKYDLKLSSEKCVFCKLVWEARSWRSTKLSGSLRIYASLENLDFEEAMSIVDTEHPLRNSALSGFDVKDSDQPNRARLVHLYAYTEQGK
jgi:hypothetical protein